MQVLYLVKRVLRGRAIFSMDCGLFLLDRTELKISHFQAPAMGNFTQPAVGK